MALTERGSLEKKLDHEFRWAVRERDGWKCTGNTILCKAPNGEVYIPPTNRLHCSHFWGRGRRWTRWDLKNADAHYAGCHFWYTQNPHDFTVWKQARLPEEEYDTLVFRAHATKKWSLQELEDMLESLQQYRETLKYDEDKKAVPF